MGIEDRTKARKKVLLVYDDQILRDILGEYLAVRGYEVVAVKSADEAREYVSERFYALITSGLKGEWRSLNQINAERKMLLAILTDYTPFVNGEDFSEYMKRLRTHTLIPEDEEKIKEDENRKKAFLEEARLQGLEVIFQPVFDEEIDKFLGESLL
jgi:CheY-like chemotaxis protein